MANEPSTTSYDPEERFHEAIASFEQARDEGLEPDPAKWLIRYADVAERLREYFADCALLEPPPEAPTPPPTVKGYRILGPLSEGGMGIVYRAVQEGPDRVVALKVIRPDRLDGLPPEQRREAIQRFKTEARAAARLGHENIVSVFEVGEVDGRPYYSMHYVEGASLADLIANGPLESRRAAVYLEQAARAVHEAHQHGILHRDLKPRNVLVETATERPFVADFGLAKLAQEGIEGTRTGAVMGTPPYMSPEQAVDSAHVTVASDVYSLGATLYALLTGRPPFTGKGSRVVLRQVIEDEPVPPRQLNARIPRDLETICLKCLQKEAGKRYASAAALAEDLRRFQAGEPIVAQPVGWPEKLWRWCRRHPAPAMAAGIIVATVVIAFALVMESRDEAVNAKDAALKLADKNGRLAEDYSKLADDYQQEARAKAKLAQQERELRQKVQRQSVNRLLTDGLYCCERGDVGRGMLLLAHGLDLAYQTKAADLEQECRTQLTLWRSRLPAVKVLLTHANEVLAVAFSSDGRRILTGGADKTVILWDAATGQSVGKPLHLGGQHAGPRDFASPRQGTLPGSPPTSMPKHAGEVVAIALSPDGRTFAVGTGDPFYRGRAQLADARASMLTDLMPGIPGGITSRIPGFRVGGPGFGRPGGVFPPRGFSPLRKLPMRRIPLLWDVVTGKPLHSGPSSELVWAVAFSPDGRTLVTGEGSFQKGPTMLVPGTGRVPLPGLGRMPGSGFGRGNPLEVLPRSGLARVWDLAKGEQLGLLGHSNAVLTVAFSPDGRRILTGSADETAQLWDAGTLRPLGKRLVHDGPVVAVAFSPDGRTILTCSHRTAKKGTVQLWNAGTGQALGQPLMHPRSVLAAVFSPDGRAVLTGSGDLASGTGEARLWSVGTGKPLGQPLPHPGPVHTVAWSPDGRHIVTGCADTVARVWEVVPVPAVVQLGHHENVLAYSADGRWVLLGTASKNGLSCEKVSLGKVASGKRPFLLLNKGATTRIAAFSADSRKILLDKNGVLHLIDAASGQSIGQPLRPSGFLEAVAISPDGQTIMTGTSQSYEKKGEATLWDANTGNHRTTFAFNAPVLSVAFSPDGRMVAAGSGIPATAEGETRVWEAGTGRPLGRLAHQGPARVVLFSPDGRTLAVASDDHTARLWDTASGQPRGPALAHNAPVRTLAFNADGELLLTGSDDQTAQLWSVSTGKRIGASLMHRGPVRAVAISGDSRLLATGSDDQTVRLWESATGRLLEDSLMHQGPVVSVAFAGAGRTLLSRSTSTSTTSSRMIGGAKETSVGLGWNSTGRVWALPAPMKGDPNSVLLKAQLATCLELDRESRVRVLDSRTWRERRKRLAERGDPPPSTVALREWHRREARAAETAGEWFAAQWHLERLGEDNPASEELHARRGRAYALSNRWKQAIAELTKTLKPKDLRAELWFLRGLAHFGLNQNDKALADFSEAISAENRRVTFYKHPMTRDAWMLWFQRAQAYFRLKQMDNVIADLSLVITQNPNHGPSWYGRGMAYAELGQLERAATDFAAALQRPNTPAQAWCDVAQARLHLGDKKGYRECCARALQRFGVHWGEDPVLAATLAWTCSLAPGATADPEQVVFVASTASNGRASYLCQRAEGAALYRAGKFQEAIKCFTHAMQLRKQPAPSMWLFLSLAHQRLNRPEEAKRWLNKAREWIKEAHRQKPKGERDTNALSWHELAWSERLALMLLQREAEAENLGQRKNPRCAPRVVELAELTALLLPQDGTSWNKLGVAPYRGGNWKAASEAMERAMETIAGRKAGKLAGRRHSPGCQVLQAWQGCSRRLA